MGKQLSSGHTHPAAWPWLHPQGSSLLPWIVLSLVSSLTAGSHCCLWPECCVEPHFHLYSSELQWCFFCSTWGGQVQRKKSPACIMRASQTQWQPCKEGCAGCQAVLRGGTQDAVCLCGTHGSSPEDPMLQKLLASALPGVMQNKGVEENGEQQHMQGSSICCKVNTGREGNWKFLSFPILSSADLGPKHMTLHSPFPPDIFLMHFQLTWCFVQVFLLL